mgnify:CR=1 FL=1
MNKSAIQKYAIWARNELIDKVTLKAFEYGVSKDEIIDANADSVNGKILTSKEKSQRQQLISKVNELGFDETIEEVAYTWFNRFIALRFMEVNNYLPTRIRVFTNENNEYKPEILKEALNLEFYGLDKQYIFSCIQENKDDELYKYLLIAQCNDMGKYLPGMFTKISDYKALLFPDNLLREDSVLGRLISDIDEDSWLDQVQSIGWLYQFYNTEPKDKVYARKKGTKLSKEDIPAVTQLFTPDWIVHYMVENSLGRIFINKRQNEGVFADGRGEDEMSFDEIEEKRISNEKYIADSMGWKYFLPEAKQEKEVRQQLNEINKQIASKDIQDIKIIDPCMGSGHILIYVFDVLMQIYEANGWTQRDAAVSILENNIYGLDIDKRAYQLAYFSIMMKARSYNRRILTLGLKPNVYEIIETNKEYRHYFDGSEFSKETRGSILSILNEMRDAKEYGSLITTDNHPYDDIINKLQNTDFSLFNDLVMDNLLPLIECAKVLSMKFDVTVTNPPYTPLSGCSAKLNDLVKRKYPDSKTDFCSVFMERCHEMTKKNGYQAMITMHSWMFLSSFEKLRKKILINNRIMNMAHLGARAFEEIGGEVVQTTSFVFNNSYIKDYNSSFKRLVDFKSQDSKELAYLEDSNLYQTKAINFSKIPGSPIAYWISSMNLKSYERGRGAGEFADFKHGMSTGKNEAVVRNWQEVDFDSIAFGMTNHEAFYKSKKRYVPYNKGGEYRKWYGNQIFVLGYDQDYDKLMDTFSGHRHDNRDTYFKECISWSKISSGELAMRYYPNGFVYDVAGCSAFMDHEYIVYMLAFFNGKVKKCLLSVMSPTLNYEVGQLINVPLIYENTQKNNIDKIGIYCIKLSKLDWDSFEISWDFTVHPLINNHVSTVSKAYSLWSKECDDRFNQLKANEEELNRIFIDIYGLQDELDPYVEDKDVTVRKADLVRDIKSLISYAVGCMFGRYSLNVEGLAYAGGEFDWNKYQSFTPDKDNIIPICDDEYFEDDIVGRFIKFIEIVYGKSTLDENLSFIASALGGKGNPREVIRSYFLNDFYKDHCKIYQKRPIYWLFDSGKKNGFKALMYIHRYQPDLIARLRTDYVHETQSRLSHSIDMINTQLDSNLTTSEKVRLNKELTKFKAQAEEVKKYEEIVHHWADKMEPMDLDDGVKVNYEKFKALLAKIK